jgi:protein-disulfide isomerase
MAILMAATLAVVGLGAVAGGCKQDTATPTAPAAVEAESEQAKAEQAKAEQAKAESQGQVEAAAGTGARVGDHEFDAEDKLGLRGAPVKGPPDALVTIVEFASYQCPFCGRAQPTLKELQEKFPQEVRFVFKQHPLPNQQNSGPAAEAALEAHAQGKFWEFHDILMANQGAIARPDLERYAEQIGLDMAAFRKALEDGRHKDRVQKDVATATAHGIRGTPNFLVNGKNIVGAQPVAAFAAAVTEEVEAMRKLMAEGKSLKDARTARLTANLAARPAQQADRAAPAQPDPNARMAVPLGQAPTKGGKEPLVTLVEFSSYQCPYCGRVRETTRQLMTEYGDDLRIVFMQRPLAFQAQSEPAARAAIAAQSQGKFWEYHDRLFDNQRELTPENLVKWAEELGLDVNRFKADMESDETRARLKAETDLGDRLAAQGTPHFFINGYRLRGAQPIDAFKAIIDREITAAKALMAAGTPRAKLYEKQQEGAVTGPPPMIGGARPGAPAAPAAPVKLEAGSSVAVGPKDAKVVLVEFSDYKCGFCGRLSSAISEIKPEYKDRVLFVKKQFPLGRWPESQKAAEGALAAHAQGKHDEFNAAIYENQRTFDDEMIFQIAEKIGLDMDRFRRELSEGVWAEQVRKDQAEGRAAGVQGTPALFLNGQKIGGAVPAEQIKAALNEALAR